MTGLFVRREDMQRYTKGRRYDNESKDWNEAPIGQPIPSTANNHQNKIVPQKNDAPGDVRDHLATTSVSGGHMTAA